MQIDNFFNSDYVDFSSYDNLRKIASYIDGLKNASRKVTHYFLNKNVNKPIRVDIASNQVVSYSIYVHGDISGTLVNMAQNYIGSNNINLLYPAGKFGKRLNPAPSATRYLTTKKSDLFDKLFIKEDNPILIKQRLEGFDIEPRFFVPILPLLLINGSQNPSIGFAQKILPRNPKDIKRWLKSKLKGKNPTFRALPYFNGFKGEVKQGLNTKQVEISGKIERKTITRIYITELPIGYNLTSYIKKLKSFKDSKKIKNFKDLSNTKKDEFLFEVIMESKILKSLDDYQLLDYLSLIKRETENFTTIDEYNKIRIFENENDLINAYYNIRLEYYKKRKNYNLQELQKEIDLNQSKYIFILKVINKEIEVNGKKREEIINQIEKYPNILRLNDYDYLLRLPLYSLTSEKLFELENQLKFLKEKYINYEKETPENLWLKDLEKLK